MSESMLVGRNSSGGEARLLLKPANRHGLIAGATRTGKTTTLKLYWPKVSARRVSRFSSPT